jgi:uncharacterized OB-fold protein
VTPTKSLAVPTFSTRHAGDEATERDGSETKSDPCAAFDAKPSRTCPNCGQPTTAELAMVFSPTALRFCCPACAPAAQAAATAETERRHADRDAANRRHRVAKELGTSCGRCGEPIAADAPLWWYRGAPHCAACAPLWSASRRWGHLPHDAVPCVGCGRPVSDLGRVRRWYPSCSIRCVQRSYREKRPAVQARRARRFTCPSCGEVFSPRRADSRYCCPACRQWAYRRRKGTSV